MMRSIKMVCIKCGKTGECKVENLPDKITSLKTLCPDCDPAFKGCDCPDCQGERIVQGQGHWCT